MSLTENGSAAYDIKLYTKTAFDQYLISAAQISNLLFLECHKISIEFGWMKTTKKDVKAQRKLLQQINKLQLKNTSHCQ